MKSINFFKIFVLSLFFVCGAVCWASGSIVGGQGVGPIRLGQNQGQVVGLLGKPDRVQSSPNDPNAKMLFFNSKGLAVFMGSNGGVIGISVLNGSWKTAENIGIGSSGEAVYKTYGQGLQRGQGNVNYASRGLAFSIRNNRVISIYVFKREDDRPLLGDRLIIPGRRVGDISIGMANSKVVNEWGQADSATPLGSGNSLYRYREEAVGLIVSSNGVIQGMVMETGDFITKEGIKVGSSKEEVLRVFGPCNVSNGSLLYEKKGIGFRLTQGRVSQITVLAPGR
ncbi:hypothetical protein IJT10_04585 [bacterium]|nr:hypothetical protein [bacterium]